MNRKEDNNDSAVLAEVALVNDLVSISRKARYLFLIRRTVHTFPQLLNRMRIKRGAARTAIEKRHWLSNYSHLKVKTRLI